MKNCEEITQNREEAVRNMIEEAAQYTIGESMDTTEEHNDIIQLHKYVATFYCDTRFYISYSICSYIHCIENCLVFYRNTESSINNIAITGQIIATASTFGRKTATIPRRKQKIASGSNTNKKGYAEESRRNSYQYFA